MEMAKRKDGDGPNRKTVDADQVTYQKVFFDSASSNVHQPIPGPRSQNNRSSDAVQVMRDVPFGGVQQHQQQQGNGPDTTAQVQETARPGTAVQQRRQKQRPKTAARTNVKIPKRELLDPSTVSADRSKMANRRFVCPQCAKTFYYKHVLQNHIRTHTGEKPYTCLVCQKKFTRAHHLTTHKRLHTGEKPYFCMCCKRFFLQVSNLRRHLKTHADCTSMNLCFHCGMVFPTVGDLAVHKVQVETCYQRNQSLGTNTASSTSVASNSAAAAIDSTSTASTSAASVDSTSATVDSTSASVDSTSATVDSTFSTGSVEPSASAFVANLPPVSPWSSSTPPHLHSTSVRHAPAPRPFTNYGSSLPWVPNTVGYPPPSVHPYWSPWSRPVYGDPTHVYSSPVPSFPGGSQPQPLMTSGPPPSLPNDYWAINPYHQYQNMYGAQQTEPEDLSVRMDVPDKLLFDTDGSDVLVDTDDSGKLVIVTDDSGELVVDV